ncbi:hypothetical protein [Streptomyces triticiradicis]|uniref:Uncharacterized protein n=1 Tax=Streptomyces triticiradicis TaxID=2651189 RepID=A0A7J5DLH1_9ACTN|nr:hypothetical protein F8144_07995 [Streptomyces triticiradicis]
MESVHWAPPPPVQDPPIYRALMRAWADRGRALPGQHDPEWARLVAPSVMYGYGRFGALTEPREEERFAPGRDPREDGHLDVPGDPRREFRASTAPRGEFGAGTAPRGEFGAGADPRVGLSPSRDPRGAAR